ncbi:Zinc finger protein 358 [Frankliniella fusca]|uniref:Zinc finger protein 358 n=1 Tax=Frankliniella fusca TaxID=407009 RepID=A0AAE1H0U1_9NEOP|nr:Zinc finger protein 358 [Frankliniella fusca]
MSATDSPDVLQEVEALFKKLQHLPESIRQKALSCIQEKLPDSKLPQNAGDTSSRRPGPKSRKGESPNKTTVKSEQSIPLDTSGENDEGIFGDDGELTDASQNETTLQNDSPSKGKGKVPSKVRVKKEVEDIKSPIIDERTPVVLLEDVKTLHGRRTKRINAANLIRGIRKPRAQQSSPKSSVNETKSRDVVIEGLSNLRARKNTPVPSDVAESAEILASLSNEISQKDLSQAITLNVTLDQADCLKDKTNSQESEDSSNAAIVSNEGETTVINVKIESDTTDDDATYESELIDDEMYDPLTNADEEDEDDPEIEKEEFDCHFCDFKTKSKFSLSLHVKKHKENIPKGSSKSSKPGSKAAFTCTECNKTFSQACGLQLHIKRHRNERDFACPHCDYKAYTKVDLTRHQTIHTGEKNKICEFCGKAFAKDSTLRDHVKAIHERNTKHECEICGFVTHRPNNLRVHIRMRHHGEYNNHVCPVCGASVKQKNAFLEHMRSHTGERPYKCEECTASFACLARLNVHRNAVHGERLFKCGDCDKSFQTKHHLLRHHAIHTKERPYACPFCSFACNTQGNIAKHVRSIHNCPDFSYRKYKIMQENGGQPRQVDPEWVRKGEEVTKEYLNSLSEKLGRPITLDELWDKEKELQKKKEEQERTRQALKEQKAAKAEAAGTAYMSKAKKRGSRKGKQSNREDTQDDVDDPSAAILISDVDTDGEGIQSTSDLPFYKLVSQAGNIQLCLETDEVQVYTGDATRELSLLQMKNDENITPNDEIQTIQGYMNEHGQFVRLDEGSEVNEDSSTVVVIIDSELNEGLTPEVADVMEVSCEDDGEPGTKKRSIECDVPMQDSKRKKSVIRIIKQEIPDD